MCPGAAALSLAGGGANAPLWRNVVGAVTALPVLRHRFDEAASVGARLLVGIAQGESVTVEDVNPVVERESAGTDLVAAYAEVRRESDRCASRFMDSNL